MGGQEAQQLSPEQRGIEVCGADEVAHAVALVNVTKLPIFPSTSRANVADFLLHSAVQDTFIRQTVIVTDTK